MKHKTKNLNKKGSVLDIMFVVFIMFAIALIIFVTKNFYTDLTESFVEDGGVFEDNNESKNIIDSGTKTINSFNWMFVLIFVLVISVIAILAYNLEMSHGTIMIAIFLLMIAVVVAGSLSNYFQEISADTEFTNATNTFTAPTHVMSNFGMYIFAGGVIILVVMFISYRKQSGGIE